jgi:hypothetical protein
VVNARPAPRLLAAVVACGGAPGHDGGYPIPFVLSRWSSSRRSSSRAGLSLLR